jgi:broad specificity polyphosphatase/5'/3'-nucleotidase SurE
MLGIHSILRQTPDIVISVINYGDNHTFQDFFASGIVAISLNLTAEIKRDSLNELVDLVKERL